MSVLRLEKMSSIFDDFTRYLIVILFCSVSFIAHANEPVRLSQPIASDQGSETFGSPLDLTLPMVELKSLMKNAHQKLGKKHLIFTKIAKVCQKKGCFFIAQQDDIVVRVSFKDYDFFIPTDSANKTVMMAGELVKMNLTEENAKHYNADLGVSNKVQPGEVLEIVVESIKIPL